MFSQCFQRFKCVFGHVVLKW